MKHVRSQHFLFSDNTSITISQCRNSGSMLRLNDGIVYYTLSIILGIDNEKTELGRQLIQFGFPSGIEAFNKMYLLINTEHIDSEAEQREILMMASNILEHTKLLGSLPEYMFPKINYQVQKIREAADKFLIFSPLPS